jgi:hypothetical protein
MNVFHYETMKHTKVQVNNSTVVILQTIMKLTNSMVWAREWTTTTERPPLVGEVIANFCW